MRQSKAFVVGLVFTVATVASAVGELTPGFIPAPKVKESCAPFKCKSIELLPSPIISKRPPIFVCYCGSASPILIQLITSLDQIYSSDSEKRLVKLESNSTIGGMSAQYMVIEDADFANLLNNKKFSYTILPSNESIFIKFLDSVSP